MRTMYDVWYGMLNVASFDIFTLLFYLIYLYLNILEIDPRKRGIDVGAILGWMGNDIAIIAILL